MFPLFSFACLFPSLGVICCEKLLHPNDMESRPGRGRRVSTHALGFLTFSVPLWLFIPFCLSLLSSIISFSPSGFFSLASSLMPNSPPSRDLEYKCNHTMMHGTLMIFFYLAYLFFSKMESTQSCLGPGSVADIISSVT